MLGNIAAREGSGTVLGNNEIVSVSEFFQMGSPWFGETLLNTYESLRSQRSKVKIKRKEEKRIR